MASIGERLIARGTFVFALLLPWRWVLFLLVEAPFGCDARTPLA
jgi:hypothetical protein